MFGGHTRSDGLNAVYAMQEEGITFADKHLTLNTAQDARDIITALNEQQIVHYLKLEGVTVGLDAAKAIGRALAKHPEFRKALWRNIFTGRRQSEMPEALKLLHRGLIIASATLTVIDVSENALGANGMVGLNDVLRSRVCYSLQELHLNNCGLESKGGGILSLALLECRRQSQAAGTPLMLKVFAAGGNGLEDDGVKSLAKFFTALTSLETLYMPQNNIRKEGIAALVESLKQQLGLRDLNLKDNLITPAGVQPLTELLLRAQNLRTLNLGNCLLFTVGAHVLAACMKNHCELLETVDMSCNEISAYGGISLLVALAHKPHLQLLNLDGNCFGPLGCDLIIKEWKEIGWNPHALQSLAGDLLESENELGLAATAIADADADVMLQEEYISLAQNIAGVCRFNDAPQHFEKDLWYVLRENDDDIEDYLDLEQFQYETAAVCGAKEELDNADDTLCASEPIPTTLLETECIDPTNSAEDCTLIQQPCDQSLEQHCTEDDSAATTMHMTAAAVEFCLSCRPCTLQMFKALPIANKLQSLMQVINQFTADDHLILLVFTALKCAHLCMASEEALEMSMALYQQLFDYASETQQEKRILEYILMQLQLLRTEQKFESTYDLSSCRYALKQLLMRQNMMSEVISNTLNVFII